MRGLQLGGEADCFNDARVGAATAQVAFEFFPDEGGGGIRGFFQEGNGGQDHGGGTVAALEGFGVQESLLYGVEVSFAGEAFDSGDLFASCGGGGEGAGLDGAAVEEDGAGAAGSFAAAVLGSGEVEMIAKKFEEGDAVCGRCGAGRAVHLEGDGGWHLSIMHRLAWRRVDANSTLAPAEGGDP
jgi:hypothetical protein